MTEPLCALCARRPAVTFTPIDGENYAVCAKCDTEHPRDGGYNFEESTSATHDRSVPRRRSGKEDV
jgi:hypothetical protein